MLSFRSWICLIVPACIECMSAPKLCRSEESMGVTWEIAKPEQCVVSTPLCINSNKTVEMRCCSKYGAWLSNPSCTNIQSNISVCPDTSSKWQYKDGICVTTTNKTPYPFICEFKYRLPFVTYYAMESVLPETFWIPAKRDFKYNLGHFVWDDFTTDYQQNVENDPLFKNIANGNILDNDCLVYHHKKKQVEAVPCTEYHKGVCAYDIFKNNYCVQKLGRRCMQSSYKTVSSCICIQDIDAKNRSLHVKSAEISFSYQNKIVQYLMYPSNFNCSIALGRDRFGQYFWNNSRRGLNYTYWSPETEIGEDCRYAAIGKDGWKLFKNTTLINCLITQSETQVNKPKLILTLNHSNKQLIIRLRNKNEFRSFYSNKMSQLFLCLEQSNSGLKQIHPESITTYKRSIIVSFSLKRQGYVYCFGLNHETFEIIKSTVFYKDPQKCEFIANVSCDKCTSGKNLLSHSIKYILQKFKESFFGYFVRIYKIISFNQTANAILFNIHLSQEILSIDCLKEHQSLSRKIDKLEHLRVHSLVTANWCIREFINVSGQILVWVDTEVGRVCISKYLCDTGQNVSYKRKCQYDFLHGAHWQILTIQHSKLETSEQTEKLYGLLLSDETAYKSFNKLDMLLNEYSNFSSFDIYLISEITHKLSNWSLFDLNLLVGVISKINDFDTYILQQSQPKLNATDKILDAINNIFVETKLSSFHTIIPDSVKNIVLIAFNNLLKIRNVSGVAFSRENKGYEFTIISHNISSTKIALSFEDTWEAFVIIPIKLVNQIISFSEPKVVILNYPQDSFASSNISKPLKFVFSVLIPELNIRFQEPVRLYVKNNETGENYDCAYWTTQGNISFWGRNVSSKLQPQWLECKLSYASYYTLISASTDSKTLNVTDILRGLLNSNKTGDETILELYKVLNDFHHFDLFDVNYISSITDRISNQNVTKLNTLLNAVSAINAFNRTILSEFQVKLNGTNRILNSLEKIYSKIQMTSSSYFSVINTDNVLLLAFSPLSNFSGAFVEKVRGKYKISPLKEKECNITTLFNKSSWESAVVIPIYLKELAVKLNLSKIAIVAYTTDFLFTSFNSTPDIDIPFGSVFKVILPEFQGRFKQPIEMLHRQRFNQNNATLQYNCGYWVFGENSSFWQPSTFLNLRNNVTDCKLWHNTYLALLTRKRSSKLEVKKKLNDLLQSKQNADKMADNLLGILKIYSEYDYEHVYIMSQIIEKISNGSLGKLDVLLDIISFLSDFEKQVLLESEVKLDSTNKILQVLDTIFSKTKDIPLNASVSVNTTNILLLEYNKFSNYSGVALTRQGDKFQLNLLEQRDYDANDAVIWEAAVVVPDKLKTQIISSNASKIIIVLHIKSSLFNSVRSDSNVNNTVGYIFNILIPNFKERFIAPLEIYFKASNKSRRYECSFWVFDKNHSYWKKDTISINARNFMKCNFWHITHFGLLLSENPFFDDFNIFDTITQVCCILSLLGLSGIFLTALLFRCWREVPGNKILTNFSLALTLKIILIYVADLVYKNHDSKSLCISVGSLLHYIVISEFCWMLVIAVLQYKRFVLVLGPHPKHVVLKACAIGWLLPTLPVISVLALDPNSYIRNSVGLCYPSGMSLYFSVYCPVVIIVSINAVICACIMYNICNKKKDLPSETYDLYYQFRLAVMLFFLLGLTWGVWIFVENCYGTMYMFTITASLQGFVVFLFFILFNSKTRLLYKRLLQNTCYEKWPRKR